MKFGKNFESHLTIEWREQYMDYQLLKDMIKRALNDAPTTASHTSNQVQVYYKQFEEEFFNECGNELSKINDFFQEKLAESRRKHANLKIQLSNALLKTGSNEVTSSLRNMRASLEKHKLLSMKKLRFSFSEFYLSLVLLQNYQTLNETGFRKICKKYDKNFNSDAGKSWYASKVQNASFKQTQILNRMVTEVEDLYTQYLANGDRSKAMTELRVPPLGEPTRPSIVFLAGFTLGIFLVLVMAVFISVYAKTPKEEYYVPFTGLYRGPFTWVIFNFCMAFNIAGFQRAGVNYILIFELDPRNHLQPADYLTIASLFGILWSLCILAFLYHEEMNWDPFIFPLVLFIVMIVLLVLPLPILYFKSRIWLLRLTGRVVSAPFHYVGFADFWLGDQFNSLVICFADYYFILKFYFYYWSDNIIESSFKDDYFVSIARALPAWFRFAQCLHRYYEGKSKSVSYLLNAGKYSTSFVVVFFVTMKGVTAADYAHTFDNPYVWGYLISATISTIYCLSWDVLKDFYLLKVWRGPNIFLRTNLIYPKVFYYFVLIENFILRFFWAINFYCGYQQLVSHYLLTTISSLLEIFRRFIWNYVRLENEHLNNCGRFRATRDIFLGTLNERDQHLLEELMDDEDGVKNRRKYSDLQSSSDRKIDKEFF